MQVEISFFFFKTKASNSKGLQFVKQLSIISFSDLCLTLLYI